MTKIYFHNFHLQATRKSTSSRKPPSRTGVIPPKRKRDESDFAKRWQVTTSQRGRGAKIDAQPSPQKSYSGYTENLGRSWKRFSKSWPMVASCGLPWPSTAVHGIKLRRPDSVPRVVPRVLLRRPLRYAPLSVQLCLGRALWLLQSF